MASGTTADWFLVWATVGLALVALAGYFIAEGFRSHRASRRRPTLSIAFDRAASQFETQVLPIDMPMMLKRRVFYVRLSVRNEPGRDAATETQILLQGVHAGAGPRPLTVAALNWTGLDEATVSLGAGVTRTADLGWLDWGGQRFELGLVPAPADGRHVLQPGQYDVRLVVTANNCDAVFYRVHLDFDGQWSEDEHVWGHLRVRVEKA